VERAHGVRVPRVALEVDDSATRVGLAQQEPMRKATGGDGVALGGEVEREPEPDESVARPTILR
jgi:hypothetical protein